MDNDINTIKKVSVTLNITVVISLITLGVTLSILYMLFPDQRDNIRFVTILIGGGSAIYSAYYSGMGLQNKIAQEKVMHAQGVINAIYDVNLTKFRIRLNKFDSKSIPPNEQYNEISKDEEIVAALRISFNLFESLSIAIQHGYADEVIAQKALGFIVCCNMFDTFKPYISTVRKRNENKLIYIEVEKLAISWENRKHLSSRHDFQNNHTN